MTDGKIHASDPFTVQADAYRTSVANIAKMRVKMDMDLYLVLYERLASGDYIRLFSPSDEIRASYARDRVHRHLLKAGERQELTFRSERMTSRQLSPGSRLVLVLGINKRPDREINYGTGNDVSEESIADGKIPVKIRWHTDSYIEIPIRR